MAIQDLESMLRSLTTILYIYIDETYQTFQPVNYENIIIIKLVWASGYY